MENAGTVEVRSGLNVSVTAITTNARAEKKSERPHPNHHHLPGRKGIPKQKSVDSGKPSDTIRIDSSSPCNPAAMAHPTSLNKVEEETVSVDSATQTDSLALVSALDATRQNEASTLPAEIQQIVQHLAPIISAIQSVKTPEDVHKLLLIEHMQTQIGKLIEKQLQQVYQLEASDSVIIEKSTKTYTPKNAMEEKTHISAFVRFKDRKGTAQRIKVEVPKSVPSLLSALGKFIFRRFTESY